MKYEKGNWPAQNTKGILRSIEHVLKTNNITKLTKATYQHITSHMGFIAHYSRDGFCDVYQNVAQLASRLLTSEYSNDPNYNKEHADHYNQECFIKDYGKAYCDSVIACNIGIIALAVRYLPALADGRRQAVKKAELQRLAEKHGIEITV